MQKKIKNEIKKLIENNLKSMSEEFSLIRLEVSDSRRQGLIRAFIDKPGGITIDDCVRISKTLSDQLDVLDPIQGPYRLEVSSPGIEEGSNK